MLKLESTKEDIKFNNRCISEKIIPNYDQVNIKANPPNSEFQKCSNL